MEITIQGTAKEVAALVWEIQERQDDECRRDPPGAGEESRRFEQVTEDAHVLEELDEILDRKKLTRRELAVILTTLRVRPGYSLEDFDT